MIRARQDSFMNWIRNCGNLKAELKIARVWSSRPPKQFKATMETCTLNLVSTNLRDFSKSVVFWHLNSWISYEYSPNYQIKNIYNHTIDAMYLVIEPFNWFLLDGIEITDNKIRATFQGDSCGIHVFFQFINSPIQANNLASYAEKQMRLQVLCNGSDRYSRFGKCLDCWGFGDLKL